MSNPIDDRALGNLMEESADLHAESMRNGRTQLADFVSAAKESAFEHSRGIRRGTVIAGAAGAAVLAGASGAFASTSPDVAILQTAASIENLAIATYDLALTLPFIGGSSAIPTVKAFVEMTVKQHKDHAAGFNAAVKALGGKEQHAPDPYYLKYVDSKKSSLTSPAPVVELAIALEDVAAQTYTHNVSQVSTADLRNLFASVAGVEAQHKAILLAVGALVAGGATQLIKIPTDVPALPKAAGSVGFPDAFYPTKSAAPSNQGAVK